MHASVFLLLLFAGPTASDDSGAESGAESESGADEDSGDEDPGGAPKPGSPKAKGCRLAGDAGPLALLPALVLLRRRARRL